MRKFLHDWLCNHGWHDWELWIGDGNWGGYEKCRWCGKVEHDA